MADSPPRAKSVKGSGRDNHTLFFFPVVAEGCRRRARYPLAQTRRAPDDVVFFVLEGAISYRPQRSLGPTAPQEGIPPLEGHCISSQNEEPQGAVIMMVETATIGDHDGYFINLSNPAGSFDKRLS